MPVKIKGSRDFKRALRRLEKAGPDALVGTFKRVGFEIIAAQKKRVRQDFRFAGPNTSRFIQRALRFKAGKTPRPFVEITAARRGGRILAEHVNLTRFEPGPGHLSVPARVLRAARKAQRGRSRTGQRAGRRGLLAIPMDAKRGRPSRGPSPGIKTGRGGKVPKGFNPSTALKPGGRGFVSPSGKVLLIRKGRKRASLVAAFRLVSRGTNKRRFKFFKIARKTFLATFAVRAQRELTKDLRAAYKRARG